MNGESRPIRLMHQPKSADTSEKSSVVRELNLIHTCQLTD